jgi:hypothetical protein
MDRPMNPIEEMFWSYIRGDLDTAAFEAWVYASPDLEAALGSEDFFAIASCDFQDKSVYNQPKDKARDIITRHFPRRCECLSIPDAVRYSQGSIEMPEVDEHVDVLAERTPWIRLARCRECGTHWLQGFDSDDFIFLHRLSPAAVDDILTRDRWPADFDDEPNLWPSA